MQIKNSVFLVTGGASDHYGRATVEGLLKEGARVIICDHPTRDLHIYGDEKAIFLPIKAIQEDDVKTLISVVKEKYGKLDGIVNCIDHYKILPVYDVKKKGPHGMGDFAEIVHENVLGPFNIVRYAIPLMAKNIPRKIGGRGVIINMSSAAAFEGPKGSCAYAASKAAIIRMTEAMNLELQGIQIRCLTILTNQGLDKQQESNGFVGNCFNAKEEIGEEPRKFAQMVKTVIETPSMISPIIRLESVSMTNGSL